MDPYIGGGRISRRVPQAKITLKDRIHKIWKSLEFEPYSMQKRPSLVLWLKATWLDIFTMLVLGAIAIGVSLEKLSSVMNEPTTLRY